MPIDATVPHWLEALAKPIDTRLTGQVFGTLLAGATNAYRDKQANPSEGYNFSRGIEEARMSQSDPMWSMKKDVMSLQIAQHALELQKTQGTLDMQKVKVGMLAKDGGTFPNWLRDNPTWNDRQFATPPVLMTKEFQDLYNKIVLDDARNIQHVAATAAIKDLSAKVNELTTLNPEKGGQFSRLIGTKVDPKDLDVLNTTLTEERQKRDNAIAAQATAGGLQPARMSLDKQGRPVTTFERPFASSADKPMSPLGKLQSDRAKALAAGDTEAVAQYDSAIQEAITNKGKSIYVGTDAEGKPVFQMTEGGSKPIGAPTTATKTSAQGKITQYENATELMNYLEHNLTEQHVGFRGAGGELLIDKSLEQLIPGVANKGRANVRATLTSLREALMRELSDDRTGRFSVSDRNEIEKALPSNGVFESKADAINRIQRVREILASRGKVYSRTIGQEPPVWSLSKEEIKQKMQEGKLSQQDALNALMRFH